MRKLIAVFFTLLSLTLCASENIIERNQTVADKLIMQAMARKAAGKQLSQTDAYLTVPAMQEKVRLLRGLADNETIINQMLAQEHAHVDTYYVFYTTVPHLRALQDVTRELYKKRFGPLGALGTQSFQFMRFNPRDPFYGRYPNVSELIIEQIDENGMMRDTSGELKTRLISTNLSLFANQGTESSYQLFLTPQKWAKTNPDWIKEGVVSLGYPARFVDEIMALQESVKSAYGDIIQIFVPKKLINRIGYLSWHKGIPFDIPFLQFLLERTHLDFKNEGHLYGTEIAQYRGQNLKTKWLEQDPETATAVTQLLTNIKTNAFHLDPFLSDRYENNPASLADLDFYQARLLAGPALLDPQSGIHIYRHTKPLSKEKEQNYQASLLALIDAMDRARKEDELQKKVELARSASVLPYAMHNGQLYFLLGREPNGKWSDFGGEREENDATILQTALREFSEETRYVFGKKADEWRALPTKEIKQASMNYILDRITHSLTRNKDDHVVFLAQIEYISPQLLKRAPRVPHYEKRDYRWVPAQDFMEVLRIRQPYDEAFYKDMHLRPNFYRTMNLRNGFITNALNLQP